MQGLDLRQGLILFIILVSSLILREWARGWVALKLGDDTAEREGRVTLNPVPHIDLFTTIILPLVSIFLLRGIIFLGAAKPTPINVSLLRHGAKGEVLVYIAGSLCNLALTLLAAVVGGFAMRFVPAIGDLVGMVIAINAWLFVFNMLPVPPFDGGYVLRYATDMTWDTFHSVARWAPFAVLAALYLVEPVQRGLAFAMTLVATPAMLLLHLIAG